jgi:2-haloacid dehalogenase
MRRDPAFGPDTGAGRTSPLLPSLLQTFLGESGTVGTPRVYFIESSTMSFPDPTRLTTLTFDCYGTLIDWETGAITVLRPLLLRHGIALSDEEIITTFQDLDGALCEPPYKSYRSVLAGVIEGFGRRFGFPVEAADREVLATSVASWQPFPDTLDALRALGGRYRLAVISNIDDDLFSATVEQLGVKFDLVVTAQQARCYKPHLAIFEEAHRRLAVEPRYIAHVAEGVTEIPPARRLGCTTIWVRRHGRSARLLTEAPDLEVPDLNSLLVPMGADG